MIPAVLSRVVEALAEEGVVVRVNRLEAGDNVPALVVRSPYVGPASHPAPTWWRGLVQIDVLDTDDLAAYERAADVNDTLADLIGDKSEHAVIAEVMPAGLVPVSPSGFLPAVGHWIASVTVTARRPTPMEDQQ